MQSSQEIGTSVSMNARAKTFNFFFLNAQFLSLVLSGDVLTFDQL